MRPLGDRVIVERVEQDLATASGIVLPAQARDKPTRGKVIAIGDEVDSVSTGEVVLFSQYGGTELSDPEGDRDLVVLRLDDILAVDDG